ncbi:hypothetical protein ACLB2K_033248 [Fragaria x ananassa]
MCPNGGERLLCTQYSRYYGCRLTLSSGHAPTARLAWIGFVSLSKASNYFSLSNRLNSQTNLETGLSTSLGSISQSRAKVSSERYRGEERRGEARRGEARRGEARRGEERRGESRRARRGEARRDSERELARVNFSTRQNFSNQCLTRGADTRSTQRTAYIPEHTFSTRVSIDPKFHVTWTQK